MLRTSTLGSTGSLLLRAQPERDEARDQSDRDEQSADDLLTAASPEDQVGSPPHEDGQPRQHAGKDEISHGADLVAGPLRPNFGWSRMLDRRLAEVVGPI